MPRHRRVPRVDAGAPELQHLAGPGFQLGQVELARGVEAGPGSPRAPDQAVGADDRVAGVALGRVEHEQVVRRVVEAVEVARRLPHRRGRGRLLLAVEDAVTQRLGRPDLVLALGEPHREGAGAGLDRRAVGTSRAAICVRLVAGAFRSLRLMEHGAPIHM